MFGPLTISTDRASSGGGGSSIWRSSIDGLEGAGVMFGGSSSSRGSAISPLSAVAAAVAGEQR